MADTYAIGSLEGIVQPLGPQGDQHFLLYDALLDRAVTCFLSHEQTALRAAARQGGRMRVTGRICRDAVTGRALAIRDIWDVTPLPTIPPGQYAHARGVLKDPVTAPPAQPDSCRQERKD